MQKQTRKEKDERKNPGPASFLIKNGLVVTAVDSFKGDILVADGKIQLLGKHLEVIEPGAHIIDATGLLVLPGGIDPHVHMELPSGDGRFSADDFETGTRAAIAGGTTSIIDFVTPGPGQPLPEALNLRKKEAQKSLCDYALHMSITSWHEGIPAEMAHCVQHEGITSFKVYMAYKKNIGLEDKYIMTVMDTAAKLKARVMVHCENDEIIRYLQKKYISAGKTAPKYHALSHPDSTEADAVGRALLMADTTGCSLYIVHLSSARALKKVLEIPAKKPDIAVETCPHYLLLNSSEYERTGSAGAAYIMSPPLRTAVDGNFLWQAIAGNYIQVVATDHCPFNKNQKEEGLLDFTKIPNGVGGIEHRMALLYTYGVLQKKISLNQWVAITSTMPARIFGLYPRKGALVSGADADILLWDPRAESTISTQTHLQKCDTDIYEGFVTKGKPHLVMSNGQIAYRDNKIELKKNAGHYLYR
ncbi:MAG TPA: dihydropyrimidinase [Candidatus Deferrimicrobium sp.]|nr:dihydropyrimidinase [Candidatus Deferrimicrobium sp.]